MSKMNPYKKSESPIELLLCDAWNEGNLAGYKEGCEDTKKMCLEQLETTVNHYILRQVLQHNQGTFAIPEDELINT